MEWRQRRGNILSVDGDFPRRELGNVTAFSLKKMGGENHGKKSIVKKNSPFFFALPLCVSTREQLMAAAGQAIDICGH